LGHCRARDRVDVTPALLGKGNELRRHLQKRLDHPREVDDQCIAVDGGLDNRHGGRHNDHASPINTEYPQYLVTRATRRSNEQSPVIDRPSQLSNPLVLARLTAKRAQVVDRHHEGRPPGRRRCSSGHVHDVNGLEKTVYRDPETAAPER
jgi:hypothetical protein